MKCILSHDIDHLTVLEHQGDLIIPNYLARTTLEFLNSSIGLTEFADRIRELFSNQWQHILEIIAFNLAHHIPGTFFIGLGKRQGLAYSVTQAAAWIQPIIRAGSDIGVHGIAFDEPLKMKHEFELFKTLSGMNDFGIRMHYLRTAPGMVGTLSDIGYRYDSTLYQLENPYRIGRMWEFPLHLMDVNEIFQDGKYQKHSLKTIIARSRERIELAMTNQITYLTVLHHDRYFSRASSAFQDWYFWIIDYLQTQKIEFINYRDAIQELEQSI